jgi:hypothetical protein
MEETCHIPAENVEVTIPILVWYMGGGVWEYRLQKLYSRDTLCPPLFTMTSVMFKELSIVFLHHFLISMRKNLSKYMFM